MYCLTGAAREYRKMVAAAVVVYSRRGKNLHDNNKTQIHSDYFFCGPLWAGELLLGKDYYTTIARLGPAAAALLGSLL